MKRIVFLIAVAVLACFSVSCKESITDSRPRIIRPPQDMIWTADTLKGLDQYAQLIPRNLFVFSANDAWLTCWSDIARGLIWHFDGKAWTESNIAKDVGGMRIQDINGYSSRDLWACGYTGDEIFLAHYDGSKWTKYNTNGIKGELLDMCKDADGNIWACGRNGLIMKYDKTKWNIDYVKINFSYDAQYFLKGIEIFQEGTYLIATTVNQVTLDETYYYVKGKMNQWTIVDSVKLNFVNPQMKWGNYKLFTGLNLSLYSTGLLGCWKLAANNWVNIYNYDGILYDITGESDNYLILCSAFKTLMHYNGNNWQDFSSSLNVTDPGFVFNNVWTNGYEAIITGYKDGDKVIVWRGK
ncbi:MAG: hypothetical protein WCZ90_15105 [Melioribacteraceae bacterium]